MIRFNKFLAQQLLTGKLHRGLRYMKLSLLKGSLAGVILSLSSLADAALITETVIFDEYGARDTDQNDFEWKFDGLSSTIDTISIRFDWEGMDFSNKQYKDNEYFEIFSGSTSLGEIGDYDSNSECVKAHPGDSVLGWGSECKGSKTFTLTDSSLWNSETLYLVAKNSEYIAEEDEVEVTKKGVQGKFDDVYTAGFVKATISYEDESVVVPVPEPTTLSIFVLSIMGLAARRFKKLL